MQNASKLNLQQIQQFLHSSEEIRFKGKGRAEIYAWVARTLRQHGYSRQNRAAKGLLRQYLVKMTGLSRAQITRLIQQYRQGGELQPARYRRHRFARKYTPADVELLAAVDEAHETLSGPATRKILEREYQQYQQREYERLAGISVAQIYRLRRRSAYRQRRLHFTKTRPTAVSIGERRRTKVIPRFPTARSCLTLLYASLTIASKLWRVIPMSATMLRQFTQLRTETMPMKEEAVA